MISKVVFQNNSYLNSEELDLLPGCVFFHGSSVDARGESAIKFKCESIEERVLISYDHLKMEISVGGHSLSADKAIQLFESYANKNIVLEATTLGFSELFLTIKSLLDLNVKRFVIIYVEPQEYTRTKRSADSFALTELNAGYKPIPNSVVDLSGDDVEAGVFFLGFEPDRLERAFEEFQMLSSKDIKVVFGVPAYQPGWELNAIIPHLEVIDNCSISYCAANDPSSAFDALEETLGSLNEDNKMFVAPIGTKPCGVASAIFASLNSSQVGVLYDHRTKKHDRSTGVSIWHKYSIQIRN